MQHLLTVIIDTTAEELRTPGGFGAIDWPTVGLNLHEVARLVGNGLTDGTLRHEGKPLMKWKTERVPWSM
jgi:hypothetical protein